MWSAINKLLKGSFRFIKKVIFIGLPLSLVIIASAFTPIFSDVGIFILNNLPIPDAAEYQEKTIQNNLNADNYFYNNNINSTLKLDNFNTSKEINELNHAQATHKLKKPTAYVVLGGGLTHAGAFKKMSLDSNLTTQPEEAITLSTAFKNAIFKNQSLADDAIVLNQYSLSRVQTAYNSYQKKPLPIVLTGVEAPWMRNWLKEHDIHVYVTENASMNTCENARFTAKRLSLENIYLITDAYHMTRARRQFALNGIYTIPIVASLPIEKSWQQPKNNLLHSRRTIYELAAYARDVFFPQDDCRDANDVSYEMLMHSRMPNDVKTFH